MTSLSATY